MLRGKAIQRRERAFTGCKGNGGYYFDSQRSCSGRNSKQMDNMRKGYRGRKEDMQE